MPTVSPSRVLNHVRLAKPAHPPEAVCDGVRRVFFLLDSLHLGGTESQAVELALRLDPARYLVTLGCLNLRGPLLARLQGSRVSVLECHVRGGVDSPNGIYQMLRLARFLRRGKFQVLHSHDLWSNLLGIPAGRLARVPVIISSRRDLSHLSWYTPRKRRFLRHLQRFSSVVLVNAEQIREQLVGEDGFPPEQIRVVHNGIDLDRYADIAPDREQLFPGLENCKLIVTTGNMHSDIKGHPTLIEAASRICPKFPQLRFILVGDGERRKHFESRIAELGLRENFILLGSRQDIPELLACCDIAVLPSRAEGFSNALLEYMARALPTIATHVGGNREIIQHGVTGLLIPPDDPVALESAILSLLENPGLASQLAIAGRERARTCFGLERLIGDVDALYTQLLHQRRGFW
jgi:L-malate glycosyltransferase